MGLGLIIKRENTKSRPRDRLELAFDGGGVATGAVGLPTSVLTRIMDKGNTISASTRRAKETASLNTLGWYNKNDSSKGLVVV